MPHSFSHVVSMNLEHSIKEGSHERYPDHLQCFRNIKKIKYPDFQAMTSTKTAIFVNSFKHFQGMGYVSQLYVRGMASLHLMYHPVHAE